MSQNYVFTSRQQEEKPMPSLKRPAELQNWRPAGLQQPRKPQRRGLLRRFFDRVGVRARRAIELQEAAGAAVRREYVAADVEQLG